MNEEIENQGNEEEVTVESITIPILGQGRELVIWPIESKEELPEQLSHSDACGWVVVEEQDDTEFIHIIFYKRDNPVYQAGIIAHECLHVLRLIHEYTGQNFNVKKSGDDEFACYLLQWLVEQCYLKLTNNEEE